MKLLLFQHSHLPGHGILLLIIGLSVRYTIGRRRFNRRSIAGIQGFKAYSFAVITLAIERLANVCATICLILALLLFIVK